MCAGGIPAARGRGLGPDPSGTGFVSTHPPSTDPMLQKVNRLGLIERLADDIAHEIKNPLHSMVINLEVLRRRLGRAPEGESRDPLRYLGVLEEELQRLTERTDLLLRLARPAREAERVTLTELVEELSDLIHFEAALHRVQVETDLRPVPGHVSHRVAKQLLLNLVFTAVDSLPPGATLRISTREEPGGSRLLLRGADSAGEPISLRPNRAVDAGEQLAALRSLAEEVNGHAELRLEDALVLALVPA